MMPLYATPYDAATMMLMPRRADAVFYATMLTLMAMPLILKMRGYATL